MWEETDEATRLKMQLAFGLRAIERVGYREVYGAVDQLRKQLAVSIPAVDDETGKEVLRWIAWCREFAPKRIIGQGLSRSQQAWLSEWQELLLK